jgi:hypothetical protein
VFVASGAPRYKLVACEILYRELCWCAALSPNIVDLEFLPKGLHDLGEEKMRARLQQAIDAVPRERYQAILLGYALCNNGIRGLSAPLPLVVPRAHDCITLLLGSKDRYQEVFQANPGTYFQSTGWLERNEAAAGGIAEQLGLRASYEDYVGQYGEDNARYLMEVLGDGLRNYSAYAYIGSGFGDFRHYERLTQEDAQARGWSYSRLEGELGLLRRLVDGPWDEAEFLVVPPGKHPVPSHDAGVIRAE